MAEMKVPVMVDDVRTEANGKESEAREQRANLIVGEEMSGHNETHEDYKNHRQDEKTVALPKRDDQTS
jgi:hypothetical protein